MAIKPILFNIEMVRAILDGRKTCTRRVAKNVPDHTHRIEPVYENGRFQFDCFYSSYVAALDADADFCMPCFPPYQQGDILYVRETWQFLYELDGNEQPIEETGKYYYAATDITLFNTYVDENGVKHDYVPWRPSIHMPKEAARIWLKVTDVRVERLQECGEGWCVDIEKEGIVTPQDAILYISDDAFHNALRMEFQKNWESTIKKSDLYRYGWDANPWVWVIEFERCEKPKEEE
jgi:hypothetical protein